MKTVVEIEQLLREADARELEALARALADDPRKGVKKALEVATRRVGAEQRERERIERLYTYQEELAGGGLAVGLDEVGRGPLAGPLTVAAVVLPREPRIGGLNDSKQLSHERRSELAAQVKDIALAWSICHAQPADIDELGMAAALRRTFKAALDEVDAQLPGISCVLVDGNPLHIDEREVNVVKGDAHCASIAAASIIAKVERDDIMCEYAKEYPEYGFEMCKGYGSQKHIDAIFLHGLSPIHRRSFCHFYEQERLF